MSRAERRAYQRMNKNQDRYALPSTGAADRARAQRAKRRGSGPRDLSFSARYLTRSLVAALLAGLLFFSVQWSNGPVPALVAGLVAAAVVLAVAVAVRLLQRRSAGRSPAPRSAAPR